MSVRSPLPDWRDFKRQILSWDFYQDIVDEAETRRKEEEKVHEEIKDTKLEEKEVEAFLHNLKNLTPLQKRRLEERIAEQKAELQDMADDDNRKKEMLKRNQRIAKKNKANAMALERIHRRAAQKDGVVKVPEHFEDEAHYMSSWLPSFYLECQAQIHRYKETEMSKETEHMRFNRFQLETDHLVKLTLTRTKEGIAVRQFSMEDLVLLTQEEDLSKPHPVHMMGLVEHSVSNLIVVTIFTDMSVTTQGSRTKEVAELISKEAPWYVVKITSMSTQIREFQALKGFQELYLKDYILNRDDSGVVGDASTEMQAASALELGSTEAPEARADLMSHLPEVLEKWLLEKFNPSQMNAIRDSLKVEGITLIQGPPGTGKTSTVLALLAVLLASRNAKEKRKSRKNATSELEDADVTKVEDSAERVKKLKARCPWLRANFVPFSDQEWQEVVRPGDALRKPYTKEQVTLVSDEEDGRTPQKVLVCAPSNAAVDEILRRVHRDGFLGEDGTFFKPEMTRVGPGAHSDIRKAYALREQMDRRLAGCDAPDHNKREEEKDAVLSLARIIFSTLAMAGARDMVGCAEDFDTVLVDEACQGVELSTLIPLKLGCRRLILIGDPNQLPATVFSELAKDYSNYARSLFQRLQVTHYKVNMLNTQYRMHPAISRFPSENFYDGNLLDHLDWKAFEAKNPTKWSHIPCFAPVAFFNIAGKMSQGSKSYANEDEAEFIVNMVSVLQSLYPDQDWRRKIGVISPYAEQVRLLKAMFKEKYGIKSIHDPCPVEVNTVDGFQGNEKDCIIVSLVREAIQRSNSVGFLADRRRMNVAFTRARMNLWVVGNANFLSVNADWEDFIEKVQGEVPKDRPRDSYVLRVVKPFGDWLQRYYKTWKTRNQPEASQDTHDAFLEAASKPLVINHEELEELRMKEVITSPPRHLWRSLQKAEADVLSAQALMERKLQQVKAEGAFQQQVDDLAFSALRRFRTDLEVSDASKGSFANHSEMSDAFGKGRATLGSLGQEVPARFQFFLSTSASCARMTNSEDRPPSLIFDWDDTLCPTSWMRQFDEITDMDHRKLQLHSGRIEQVLRAARSFGYVDIVTMANRQWLDQSIGLLKSNDLDLWKLFDDLGIEVHYAQPSPSRALKGDAREGISAKKGAMSAVLDKYYGDSVKARVHVLSFGDQDAEAVALQEVLQAAQGVSWFRPICKVLRLPSEPDLEELRGSLRKILTNLPALLRTESDLDLHVYSLDAR